MAEVIEHEPQFKLDEYPDRFLTCRALQHYWAPMGLPWLESKTMDGVSVQVVYERFKCSRCDTQRTDQRTPYGRFIRRGYHHEGSYRMSQEMNRKELYAGERFRRILGEQLQRDTA